MSTPARKAPRDTAFLLRQSSPLTWLADEAQAFSSECDELWVATAFVDERAVRHVIEAVRTGAKVRFLTGTFGHVTRRRTFERLERLARSGAVEARVWEGDFHIKLFIWRFGSRTVAWIGSANLTADGLKREGELVLQLRGKWSEQRQRQLRAPFDYEWERAGVLDAAFVSRYKESPRAAWLLRSSSKPGAGRHLQRLGNRGRVLLVVPVAHHYGDDSSVAARVDAVLGGAAATWYKGSARALGSVRRGHLCLLVDYKDRDVVLGVVTDTKRDGRGYVFSYDRIVRSPRPLADVTRQQEKLELGSPARRVRTQWIEREGALRLVAALFGPRAAARVIGEVTGGPARTGARNHKA